MVASYIVCRFCKKYHNNVLDVQDLIIHLNRIAALQSTSTRATSRELVFSIFVFLLEQKLENSRIGTNNNSTRNKNEPSL